MHAGFGSDGPLGCSEGDRRLVALGVKRLALPIPFKQAGGPVNAYLIDNPDGTLTLFDTGLVTPECQAALERGFAQAGRRLEEVSRVLVSHGHVDHYGLARRVQQRCGAPVYLHRADWNKVVAGRGIAPLEGYFIKLGLPEAMLAKMAGAWHKTESFGERLESVEPLEPGQRLRFARFEGEILHFPGHTPGLVCLHDPASRALFTDDHLLARVSPNPLLELGENGEEGGHRALVRYLASAKRLRAMDLDLLLPGHGEPFTGHRETLDALFSFYLRRQDRLAELLEAGPRSAFELISELFGSSSLLQLFLMLSEIVGNLEVLEDDGRVTHDPAEPVWRYRLR
jgi:glyoxylase-like metal-dependent hydrolase (beta-lactamase superfamily II)